MKYNLSRIMTKAWELFRKMEITFGEALHRAVDILIDDNCDVLNQILDDIGYNGAYKYNWYDAGKTLVIYIR